MAYLPTMHRVFSLKLLLVIAAVLVNALVITLAWRWPDWWWAYAVLGPTTALLIHDLVQREHTILRNYPLVGHARYLIEDFRHQFRQYLIESDAGGAPFTHQQRAIVYQRSKGDTEALPFGTIREVYAEGYDWFEHSVMPLDPSTTPTRVTVGNAQCSQPYDASRLNISAMSFGSLSGNAIRALNAGAKRGGFAHDTGEGGLSEHHLAGGGDIIWEIGTGYFGCRTETGDFDPDAFARKATLDVVKMIELKLSQGAKPGGGGLLPGEKVNAAIARARGVPVGETVHSPAAHRRFSTPLGLIDFLAELRELSGGKPVGFKLCLGQRGEFMAIVKAMLERDFTPDFITVDGGEGGTGAAPLELSNAIGTPLTEGLVFVRNTLAGAGLRDQIRIIACGKVIDGSDMARRIALGADMCGAARGMMFALGCIQARRCHTNRCPTGVTTNDPVREGGLVVTDKSRRVAHYHAATLAHFCQVLATTGLATAEALHPDLLYQRVSEREPVSYASLFPSLQTEALLERCAPERYQTVWDQADPSHFGRAQRA